MLEYLSKSLARICFRTQFHCDSKNVGKNIIINNIVEW